MKKISILLPLIGHIFVAVVAVISALRINDLMLLVLLVISAIVSLILAITRMITAKKTRERIKYLEENQLSVSYDAKEKRFSFIKGKSITGARPQ